MHSSSVAPKRSAHIKDLTVLDDSYNRSFSYDDLMHLQSLLELV